MSKLSKVIVLLNTVLISIPCFSQFAPTIGVLGTTAIHKDSSAFIGWASSCQLELGWQDISNTSLGQTNVGTSQSPLGQANGLNVVSLGDSGVAILSFDAPITNGPGWDFAVFENSFSTTFLELAFIEVSSDGFNFYRFPATSNTQTTTQVGGFGTIDASKVNNLAGKYPANYGTPFDLQELDSVIGLDINNIMYIKVIDVIGSINEAYASFDDNGNTINAPWPTPFTSGGFDLDAIGVINSGTLSSNTTSNKGLPNFDIFPNPSKTTVQIVSFDLLSGISRISILDIHGNVVMEYFEEIDKNFGLFLKIDISKLKNGVYIVRIESDNLTLTKRMIKG